MTCHKIGQDQPSVLYKSFQEVTPQMVYTKFQGNWFGGSGEEDFFKVFTIYEHGGHLGHVTWTKYVNFLSPLCLEATYEVQIKLAQ